jgi:penicillin-insensitive murein DD-endopeptidase
MLDVAQIRLVVGALAASLINPSPASAIESECFGTVSNGYIEHSVKLSASGSNYSAYSSVGIAAGRTHVHSRVAAIISASYATLALLNPEVTYVYGETGWAAGGRIRPHRTHQNGLSVDFFVPVRNEKGQSIPLRTDATNRFGYGIEFSHSGRYGNYSIDFAALAEHLYQLHIAAQAQTAGIALVIFDPLLLSKLFATPRGPYLQQHLAFMKGQAWVRHDEHYHVDFNVPCKEKKNSKSEHSRP